MKKKISIVIPAYNEQEVLDELTQRLRSVISGLPQYDFEVVIVENGSTDGSFGKLVAVNQSDFRFKIVCLSRNFGCDGGLIAGLNSASGAAVILMNADLQDPPEIIPEFIKKWEQGYDVVYGIIKRREGVPFFKKIMSSLFYRLINSLTKGLFPKNVSDFRLIDKSVRDCICGMSERNCFLRGMIAWLGFKQVGIPFDRPARFAGKPKAGFFTLAKVAFNGIFSFSYLPLRLVTLLGFILFIFSSVTGVVFIALFFIYGRVVPGHTSVITSMFFLFGLLFFILGVMGEYLARIYDEVKQRPVFIVKERIGFDS
ncbi:MAG: glycosyltransferase [Candidatus Omnitrophica bacterium CG_4_8_14_3_um_filter_43_15]|nr:MAG: glycosyltransferase [Candidatus Omnitrophica bacterium CG02_land_8_20_14_3_00__42_8]PIW80653.1 MAG: glycosyltransferase [Candidatus Omnitrophica bacterium CG_4_8_14_3_um_filter_43_15]